MRPLLIAALLSACTTSDLAMGDEVTCESFGDDPTYVYANGNVTIDLTGVDRPAIVLGILLTITPMNKDEPESVMVELNRWSTPGVMWNGQIGKAVQLFDRGYCAAQWVERL